MDNEWGEGEEKEQGQNEEGRKGRGKKELRQKEGGERRWEVTQNHLTVMQQLSSVVQLCEGAFRLCPVVIN